MADEREVFPAYAALTASSRAFLATVEGAIGRDDCARLPKRTFAVRGISLGHSWSVAKTRLVQLKFLIVEAGGPNGCARTANVYRLADGWRELDEAAAQQLARVERRRPPRVVQLLRFLRRAAKNGNAEALAAWRAIREPLSAEDSFALAALKKRRPDLFEKADARGKPRQPRRRSFADDHVARRLAESVRARPGR
jgi:hypothetical protein